MIKSRHTDMPFFTKRELGDYVEEDDFDEWLYDYYESERIRTEEMKEYERRTH